MEEPQLCEPCRETYCQTCCGNLTWRQIIIEKNKPGMPSHTVEHPTNCEACGGTGRLTDRQLTQRSLFAEYGAHCEKCDVCGEDKKCVAFEDYIYFVNGRKGGTGNRKVYAPKDRCADGQRLWGSLLAIGATVTNDSLWGFDGRGWGGQELDVPELHPTYREEVTWRREVSEDERQAWKRRELEEQKEA